MIPSDDIDDDGEDMESIDIFDLALKNELQSTGTISYGDLLEFTITICNQGTVTANNIELKNYLPLGLSYSSTNNTGWQRDINYGIEVSI